MLRRLLAVAAGLVLLLALAGCGGGDGGAADGRRGSGAGDAGAYGGGAGVSRDRSPGREADIEISIGDNFFKPDVITAPAGSEVTVEVTNDGQLPHTFSSEEAGFDSGTIEPGQSATVTFTMPRTETPFQCNIHGPSMSGTLRPRG